jgi:group I intron endonuclease
MLNLRSTKEGIVYKFTHRVSRKTYIGQTVKTLNRRVKKHFTANTYFGNALRKYGLLAFEISIVARSTDRKELNLLEAEWIKRCNSVWPNGYNMTHGGDHPLRSKLTRRRMSAAVRKFFRDHPEAKERLKGNRFGVGIKHPELEQFYSNPEHQRKAAAASARAYRLNPRPVPQGFLNSSRMLGKTHSSESIALQSSVKKKWWSARLTPHFDRICEICKGKFDINPNNKRSIKRVVCSRSCSSTYNNYARAYR